MMQQAGGGGINESFGAGVGVFLGQCVTGDLLVPGQISRTSSLAGPFVDGAHWDTCLSPLSPDSKRSALGLQARHIHPSQTFFKQTTVTKCF